MAEFEEIRYYDENGIEVEDEAISLYDLFSEDKLGRCQSALLTVTDGNLLYTFSNDAPVQGEPAHTVLENQSITIPTKTLIKRFRCINQTAAEPVMVYATLFR